MKMSRSNRQSTPVATGGVDHRVSQTPTSQGGRSSDRGFADSPTFLDRLMAEARADRVCSECGYERQYRRVWRWQHDEWAGGRVLAGPFLRGAMELVCVGCKPEFVVNPYEAWRAA